MLPKKYEKPVNSHICQDDHVARWAFAAQNGKSVHVEYLAGGCHNILRTYLDSKPKFKWFATCGPRSPEYYDRLLKRDHSAHQEYMEWLISKDSPWWNLHKGDIQAIKDDRGNIRGVILGPSVFKGMNNYGYFFNFLIACRMTRDHYSLIYAYSHLKKIGLSDFEAYMMSPYFQFKNGLWIQIVGGSWNACHIPLTAGILGDSLNRFTGPFILDIEKLRRGEYNINSGYGRPTYETRGFSDKATHWYSSYGWLRKSEKNETNLNGRIPDISERIKTKFSTVSVIQPERVVELAKEILV